MLAWEFTGGYAEQRPRLTVSVDGPGRRPSVRLRPLRRVASREPWPHRVFGTGVLEQAVYAEGEVAKAHDRYEFATSARGTGEVVRVDLDCDLTELLDVEDDVAAIVAALAEGAAR